MMMINMIMTTVAMVNDKVKVDDKRKDGPSCDQRRALRETETWRRRFSLRSKTHVGELCFERYKKMIQIQIQTHTRISIVLIENIN